MKRKVAAPKSQIGKLQEKLEKELALAELERQQARTRLEKSCAAIRWHTLFECSIWLQLAIKSEL